MDKKINEKIIDQKMIDMIASLAALELTDDEKAAASEDMEKMLAFFDRLKGADTNAVDKDNGSEQIILRPDEPKESLMAEEIYMLAPEGSDGMYKVPRTI